MTLAGLVLCGLSLFNDPNWMRLDTQWLDDPPMLSWSVSTEDYNAWEHEQFRIIQSAQSLDTRRAPGRGNALSLVRDCRTSDLGCCDGTSR